MSGVRRSSRGIGEYGAEYTASRPTSGRQPPASSFNPYGQYGIAGQQNASTYGTDYQYSAQYDTGYSRSGYDTGYPTGFESGYSRADDYGARAAYEEYVRGHGREELLGRALDGGMYSDIQTAGTRPTSSFNPYGDMRQSRGPGSMSSGSSKPSRPTSAKPPSKPTEREKSSSFNLFGKGKEKTSASSASRNLGQDKQKPTPSRYDA